MLTLPGMWPKPTPLPRSYLWAVCTVTRTARQPPPGGRQCRSGSGHERAEMARSRLKRRRGQRFQNGGGSSGRQVGRPLRTWPAGLRVAGGGGRDLGKVRPGGVRAGGWVGWRDPAGWHGWHGNRGEAWHCGTGTGTAKAAGPGCSTAKAAGPVSPTTRAARLVGSRACQGHGTVGVAWERPR